MRRAERSISLDLLRALAIFLVLGRHSEGVPHFYPAPFREFMLRWQLGGWAGVDLFLVLSGFLVSGLLFRELQLHGEIRVGRFLIRRGLKIYPAFFVFLFVTALVRLATGKEFKTEQLLAELFFVQNYFDGLWPHTWSLAVEEHFYLALPPILLLLLGRNPRTADPVPRILLLFSIAAALCWSFRSRIDPTATFYFRTHIAPTHMRIDSLLAGVLISAFYHFRHDAFMSFARRYRTGLLAIGAIAFSAPFFYVIERTRWIYTSGFVLIYAGAACILMGAISFEPRGRVARLLAFIGAHSYSIYLWHLASAWARIGISKVLKAPLDWWSDFLVYVAFSIGFGILMSKAVEWPVLKLRDRWFPSRSNPLAPEEREHSEDGMAHA